MNPRIPRPVAGLALAVLVSPALGCHVLLYPAARAFGGPKESELARIRPAFAVLGERAHAGEVVVFPPLLVRAGEGSADPDAGRVLAGALRSSDLAPRAVLAPDPPGVPFFPPGHNQYRYLWKRARGYAGWVGGRHPPGDYFVFTELILDAEGRQVHGAQCVIVDAGGQIAHAGLWNSHHYDPSRFSGPGPFLEWMVGDLARVLRRDPLRQYPPHGIG